MPVAAEPTFDVRRLPELLAPDHDRITTAKQRQTAVWSGQKPDKWPIIMHAPLTAEQEEIPGANYEEAFYDADRMLCSEVRGACGAANSGSDAVPSIRGNFGTGSILACLGLEQDVFPDKMPWLQQHLTAEQIAKEFGYEVHDAGFQEAEYLAVSESGWEGRTRAAPRGGHRDGPCRPRQDFTARRLAPDRRRGR